MNLLGDFRPGLLNSWILSVPLVVSMAYVGIARRDVARRMADMSGYSLKERVITVAASLAPYPFMVATIWIPFTHRVVLLAAALAIYALALTGFFMTLRALITTSLHAPFSTGPFRFSRHPLYVAATMVFIAICVATLNLALSLWLIPLIGLQHLMILAEERACKSRFGRTYEDYCLHVPRYLVRVTRRT